MKTAFFNAAGFVAIAVAAAAPAFARAVPEPEVAGGMVALVAMGVGYRALKRLIAR